MLSDKFYNLSVDVRNSMTVDDVLESEEAYFLRRINGRSNARILQMVAEAFKLNVPTTVDTCGYDPYVIASCTTESMINDMHRQRDQRVTLLSKCVDTTRIQNGVLCSMHPSEGFWLFKVSAALLFYFVFEILKVCQPGLPVHQLLHLPLRRRLWRRIQADQHAHVHEPRALQLLVEEQTCP
jgi:hypothetical protein